MLNLNSILSDFFFFFSNQEEVEFVRALRDKLREDYIATRKDVENPQKAANSHSSYNTIRALNFCRLVRMSPCEFGSPKVLIQVREEMKDMKAFAVLFSKEYDDRSHVDIEEYMAAQVKMTLESLNGYFSLY